MHLSKLRLEGFRNLDVEVPFLDGFGVLAGENNAGKTNVIAALRILLSPAADPREQLAPVASDFAHDTEGNRIADTFLIEGLFEDLDDRQQGRMVTCLAPTFGERTARLGLRARLAGTDQMICEVFGGDRENTEIEQMARLAVQFTYLPPLRDAEDELRPGRRNRLRKLLTLLVKDEARREVIEGLVAQANEALRQDVSVEKAKTEIQTRLDDLVGERFKQQVDLAFSEPQFDKIAGSLRALIGETTPLEMTESGLGFNNLLFMATVLAGLAEDPEAALHVLLVEEPEAHLHPQLQDLLMTYLETRAEKNLQVIATTHSPNFASSAGIERITVLARPQKGSEIVARSIAKFGLDAKDLAHLHRFLDVTKAGLLFARGVLLVEGVAEQILAPEIAKVTGISLAEVGVSVINIGGLAFAPFAALFGTDRLPYKCAILTDGDRPEPAPEELEGADSSLSATARKLKSIEGENLRVFLSQRTLEWDLVREGNWEVAVKALRRLRPRVADRLLSDFASSTPEEQAEAFLKSVQLIKGPFAQALVEDIRAGSALVLPQYFRSAVEWLAEAHVELHGELTSE